MEEFIANYQKALSELKVWVYEPFAGSFSSFITDFTRMPDMIREAYELDGRVQTVNGDERARIIAFNKPGADLERMVVTICYEPKGKPVPFRPMILLWDPNKIDSTCIAVLMNMREREISFTEMSQNDGGFLRNDFIELVAAMQSEVLYIDQITARHQKVRMDTIMLGNAYYADSNFARP